MFSLHDAVKCTAGANKCTMAAASKQPNIQKHAFELAKFSDDVLVCLSNEVIRRK